MVRIKKVIASTIIESVVALLLITMSFGIFLLISTKLSTRNNIDVRVGSLIAVRNEIINSKHSSILGDRTYEINGRQVKVVIHPYRDLQGIYKVEIGLYDEGGMLLIIRKELIEIK